MGMINNNIKIISHNTYPGLSIVEQTALSDEAEDVCFRHPFQMVALDFIIYLPHTPNIPTTSSLLHGLSIPCIHQLLTNGGS
jgi:hypothetical protein